MLYIEGDVNRCRPYEPSTWTATLDLSFRYTKLNKKNHIYLCSCFQLPVCVVNVRFHLSMRLIMDLHVTRVDRADRLGTFLRVPSVR